LKQKIANQATSTDLFLGIRPQHVDVYQSEPKSNKEYFRSQVYITEPMGLDQIVHLRTGADIIRAVTSIEMKFNLDDKVWVKFIPQHVHIFDKASGKAIR
jgi:multiple sugar transport system ATP-binding protein